MTRALLDSIREGQPLSPFGTRLPVHPLTAAQRAVPASTRALTGIRARPVFPSEACAAFGYPCDPPTAYALGVRHQIYSAGPHVRAAAERHLRDLDTGHQRGLVWVPTRAKRFDDFAFRILRLSGGEFDAEPLDLLPWQRFVTGALFGWYRLAPGIGPIPRWQDVSPEEWAQCTERLVTERNTAGRYYASRRFRRAYVETGKGSGKSPLAAAVGLYMQLADGEAGAEIYAAATTRDQAMVLYRDAVSMVDQSPGLTAAIKKSGKLPNVWNLLHTKSGSFFKVLANGDGHSGPRPHCGLIDELHEHPDGTVTEMVRAGFKGRRHPLLLQITNSGASQASYCWEQHAFGELVAQGTVEADDQFAYICALDKDDEPFRDETCWPKANPSLGVTIDVGYLREQVTEARGMPSKEATVLRLNFCKWVQAYNPWLSFDVWNACAGEPAPLDPGLQVHAGLDLSRKNDLSALILVQAKGEHVNAHCRFWAPMDKVKAGADGVPYDAWHRAGHILATPGGVIDYDFIAAEIMRLRQAYPSLVLHFDRWRMEDMRAALVRQGCPDVGEIGRLGDAPGETTDREESWLRPHGQGYKDMGPSIDKAEDLILSGKLRHGGHPVLSWCVANAVVVEDPAELRKFDKVTASGRIDGAVGLVMGCRGILLETPRTDIDAYLTFLAGI